MESQLEYRNGLPVMHHQVVQELYYQDFILDKALLEHILSLARESIIEDMIKVLLDHVKRPEELEHFPKENQASLLHSIHILAHYEAEEGLEAFYEVMAQDNVHLHHWFGDILTEFCWQFWYRLGRNRLDVLRDFVLDTKHYTIARTSASKCVEQLANHHEERREECIDWFAQLMNYFIEYPKDQVSRNPQFNNLFITNAVQMKAPELKEHIQKMYRELPVDKMFIKSSEEALEYISNDRPARVLPLLSISEFYEKYQSWVRRREKRKARERRKRMKSRNPDVGRNDPCPCGSGRKFKRCCGDLRK